MLTITQAARRPLVLADLLPRTAARSAVLVLGAALLTAASAQFVIPLPGSPVPVSGQTFAVMLTAAALGARRGALAQGLYILLGFALPVYAEGESGPAHLFGATGGYLVGFVLAAFVVGALAERGGDRTPRKALPLFTVGQLIIFAVGVPWLAVVAGIGVGDALAQGFLPFIPGGILKALLAAGLLPAAWSLVRRSDRR